MTCIVYKYMGTPQQLKPITVGPFSRYIAYCLKRDEK
jgi:hypothetical protein